MCIRDRHEISEWIGTPGLRCRCDCLSFKGVGDKYSVTVTKVMRIHQFSGEDRDPVTSRSVMVTCEECGEEFTFREWEALRDARDGLRLISPDDPGSEV